jgi:hypothetical protein
VALRQPAWPRRERSIGASHVVSSRRESPVRNPAPCESRVGRDTGAASLRGSQIVSCRPGEDLVRAKAGHGEDLVGHRPGRGRRSGECAAGRPRGRALCGGGALARSREFGRSGKPNRQNAAKRCAVGCHGGQSRHRPPPQRPVARECLPVPASPAATQTISARCAQREPKP